MDRKPENVPFSDPAAQLPVVPMNPHILSRAEKQEIAANYLLAGAFDVALVVFFLIWINQPDELSRFSALMAFLSFGLFNTLLLGDISLTLLVPWLKRRRNRR